LAVHIKRKANQTYCSCGMPAVVKGSTAFINVTGYIRLYVATGEEGMI